tara:strand:+ start:4301 stop:4528 length:228 start_codon:yes stop_codon:yes gene_type:complete
MQTHADFRIGTLVRWHGGYIAYERADIDELGIVTKLAVNREGHYHIAWAISKTVSHHSPEMIEESLYQGQMEIMQ